MSQEKMRSAIHELAASPGSVCVVAAYIQKRIQVWDLGSRSLLTEYPVTFVAGAKNIAMSPDGNVLVTGSCSSAGRMAAYHVQTGKVLWERRRLVYSRFIAFGTSSEHFWVNVNRKKAERIQSATGETTETIRGILNCFEGPRNARFLVAEQGAYRLRIGTAEQTIKQLSPAVIGVAFADDCLFLSEVGGPSRYLRCIELEDGGERWRFTTPEKSLIVRLHYSASDGFLYAVLFSHGKPSFRHLLRFDITSGRPTTLRDLGDSWEEAFVPKLHQIVTSSGLIVDLESGRIVDTLSFPQVKDESFQQLGDLLG